MPINQKIRLTNKIKYKKGPFKLLSRQEVQLKGLTPNKVFLNL